MRRPLEHTHLPPRAVAGLIGTVAFSAAFLIEAPAFLAFGAVVLTSVAWCIWLDGHPC